MNRISFGGGNKRTTKFRSHLEQLVADELDELGVEWAYEEPVILPGGEPVYYLPDFTIKTASANLKLPHWVEVKPQSFLYDLRDDLKVTRRYGDKFRADVTVDGCDSSALRGMRSSELWKPKRLAEVTGEVVLVVGGVGGTEKLSVEMRATEIVFSRDHPFVNQAGVAKSREREERDARWQAQQLAAQQRWKQAEAARIHAASVQRRETLRTTLAGRDYGANRHDGECCGCGAHVWAPMGTLYASPLTGGGYRFLVVCDQCRCNVERRQ